jgi:hypothetical protein
MTTTTHDHLRRRRRFLALLGFAAITASLGAGALSLALFTDTANSTGDFSTGTIDIAVNEPALFNVGDLMPGDKKPAPIVVRNDGTAELRYAIRTEVVSGTPLAAAMTVRVFAVDCTGTALGTAGFGSALLGDNTAGADTGDRTLAAGGSETLCVEVELPGSVSDPTLQGASTAVLFHFDAEQTANND